MKANYFFLMVCVLSTWAISCGDPYEAPLPADVNDKIGFYKTISSVAAEDQKLLSEYFTRITEEKLKGGPGIPAGTTVKDALAAQKSFKEEEARKTQQLREAAEKEQAAREAQRKVDLVKAQEEMAATCKAEVVKINVITTAVGRSFDMDIRFKNIGSKELVVVMGTVQFADQSGKILKEIKIPYYKALKPGASAVSGGKIPVLQDREGDVQLTKLPLSKVQVKWVPIWYKFADGTQLGQEPKPDKRRR